MMKLLDRAVFAVDLPGETIPGYPLIEILGYERLLIENHKGVVLYSVNEIIVRTVNGQIRISGCELRLARMSKEQLVIVGKLDGISLLPGGRK